MDWLICVGFGAGVAALALIAHFFSKWASEAEAAGAYKRRR